MIDSLRAKGYNKGLTIKTKQGSILYADEFTADIKHRREVNKKGLKICKTKIQNSCSTVPYL